MPNENINIDEMLNKVVELSIVNTQEIEKLKSKDQDIVTTVGSQKELLDIVIGISKAFSNGLNEVKKSNTELKLEFDEYKHQQEKDKEIAINSLRMKQGLSGYCNQKDFGNRFKVKIGAKSVGKLLRVVGIAMKSRTSETIPYDNKCPCYSKPSTYYLDNGNEIQTFKWNYEKCIKIIDEWLNDNGYFDKFYSFSKPNDIEKFITSLHITYIEN